MTLPRFSRFSRDAAMSLGVAALLLAASLATGAAARDQSDDDAKSERAISEQNIYIPYEKLRQVFEKEGRGVFLPYEKFQELWRAAQDKTQPDTQPRPPVRSLITEIDNRATVEKDVVRVKAKLKIEVLAEGWTEVPLRLDDAAITSATLADKPARILGEQGQDYRLLVEKKGKQPESIELSLEYAKVISRSPGLNSVSFNAPQAPVSHWHVTIPQAGVKVKLQPLIAATEVPPHKEDGTSKKADETVVLAFVGAAPTVRIDWTPKSEGAMGLTALASVQSEQQVTISEGVTRTRAALDYTISRAELAQLVIDVPADQKVVNVFDANVRQWKVETVEGRQRITAQLFEPAKNSQRVTVELEQFVGEKREKSEKSGKGKAVGNSKTTILAPVVTAVDVGRQQGIVVVRVAESIRAEVAKTEGLMQLDAAELPSSLRQANWAFAYRYASVPFSLVLDIEEVEPRITVDTLVEAMLQPGQMDINATAVYTIEKAGVFRLDWEVPADYTVRQVRGVGAPNASPVQVDSFHIEGEKKTRLIVNLSRKAIGRVALAITLQKDLRLPELLTPTDKAAKFDVPIPTVAPKTVERAVGRLVVSAPESLRVNPEKTAGLRSISFNEAFAGALPTHAEKSVLAFAYTDETARLTLAAQRRRPQVTVGELIVAKVEEGLAKYDFTLSYSVRYSGVKSLRIDVPKDVAEKLRVTTTGIHEKAIDPPPKDVTPDCVAWSLTGESEFVGSGKIDLSWEKTIEKLELGKSVKLPAPYLKPKDVDRAWGQIVLVKSETINVQEEDAKALQPIDPQHDLKLVASVASAARAFEFYDDWTLSIVATRYQLEDVKRSSIEQAVVRMVVTPANTISVQALYRMKSVRQRLRVELPPGAAFDSQPLRLNGRPSALEKAGDAPSRKDWAVYYVPLVAAAADTPFLLELRYTLSGDGRRLELPAFPEEPAVVKAYLAVYLPETQRLLGVRGPWTEEFVWSCFSSLNWQATPTVNVEDIINSMHEGTAAASPAVSEKFQTDGRLYLYSTLRPEAGPNGVLETTTIDRRWLDALVFGVTMLLGLVLLPLRLPSRVTAVGVAVVALVLAGVFLPTFSMQILNGAFFLAIFLVVVLWLIAFAVHYRAAWALLASKAAVCGRTTVPPPKPLVISPFVPTEVDTPNADAAKADTPKTNAPKADVQEGGNDHA
jgi:hypothetical protein